MSKKKRKAAKKAKKLSEMPKAAVSAAEIDFVAKVLHPHDPEAEEADLERQLLEDPDIKLNRAFHRGTSNRREIRNEFVKKDKHASSKAELHIDPEDLNGLLQLLDVSPLTSSSSAEEKAIHAKLKTCIETDLVNVRKETEQTMMRKAGFWRWANKRAYRRLVQNGRIGVQKGTSTPTATTETSTSSSASAGAAETETDDTTEPDTDITTPDEDEGEIEAVIEALKLDAEVGSGTPQTPKADNDDVENNEDDGWTTVGKPKAVKSPVGNVKLAHNGGLVKMTSPVTPLRPRRGFATSYEHLY